MTASLIVRATDQVAARLTATGDSCPEGWRRRQMLGALMRRVYGEGIAMTTLSWRGDPQVKAGAVAAMKRHREEDRFIRGTYLAGSETKGWVGCFHGCLTTEALAAERGLTAEQMARGRSSVSYWFEGERLWGIPVELGMVLDHAFESSFFETRAEASDWAVEVTEAIPVGVDLHLFDEGFRGYSDSPFELIAQLRKISDATTVEERNDHTVLAG